MVLRTVARTESNPGSEASCTTTTSGTDGEDSVDGFYRNHPEGAQVR
jgi:hypothetical protein